ncbi:MAG: serine/threonine-protein kinase [Oscillospiraceae bacterium]|nr:serine/threonine-protein kinase [Oscillospiraceae bacterium]
MSDRLFGVWDGLTVTGVIGQESFATVYEVADSTSAKSAVKVIEIPARDEDGMLTVDVNDEKVRERLAKVVNELSSELSLAGKLQSSSNIVRMDDFRVIEKEDAFGWTVVVRTELLTSLSSYMCTHKLTQSEVIKLGIDMCNALNSYGQVSGSTHGDIRPENIFADGNGNFKLGDFGISRILRNRIGDLPQKDSMSYTAPEVLMGNNADCRADIYSLGIVLYKLLNGNRFPLLDVNKQIISPKERQNAINRRLMGEKLPSPAEASEKVAEIVLKACAYNPAERYLSVTEFRNALSAVEGVEYQKNAVPARYVNEQPVQPTHTADETMSVRRPNASTGVTNPDGYAFGVKNVPAGAPTISPYDQYIRGKSLYEEQNYREALKWLRTAAVSGVDEAKYYLGRCYYRGYGVPVDYSDAVAWFKEAALSGLPAAQYSVGVCYYYGQGVEQDCAEAIRWFAKAAESGYAPAEYSIGECYYNGIGVKKDYENAIAWAKRAADKGYSKAQNALGICYYNGHGVEKNPAESARWFRLAAQNGNQYAKSKLEELEKMGF